MLFFVSSDVSARISGEIRWCQEMDLSRVSRTDWSFKAYSTSCKLTENSFPTDPFRVGLYLQHLIEQSQSPSVIDSAFYGIKWAHESMIWVGFPLLPTIVLLRLLGRHPIEFLALLLSTVKSLFPHIWSIKLLAVPIWITLWTCVMLPCMLCSLFHWLFQIWWYQFLELEEVMFL